MDDEQYNFNVKMDDIIAAGHCVRGAQLWATNNNIDWRRFLRDGVPATELLATGDGQAMQVLDHIIRLRKSQGVQ